MRTPVMQRFLNTAIIVVLTWLAGCAAMERYLPAATPQLTPAEATKVGLVVEARLLQLLGGPRHDQALHADLAALLEPETGRTGRIAISVADKSAAELYALPGNRVVMTRGLLAGLGDQAELATLLRHATSLAGKGAPFPETRAAHQATLAVLAQQESVYDPESGSITLARMLARRPCDRNCLTGATPSGGSRAEAVPASVGALKTLQPAYALVEEARQLEKAENPSQAIILYLKAATLAPDEPHVLGALGTAYLRAGDLKAARLHLQKAVRLQPDYYRTRMGLGYLYLQQGEVRKANLELAESVRLLPVTENLFLLAEAREKSDDVAGGMSLYQLVVEKDPHSKLGRTAANRLARSRGAQ